MRNNTPEKSILVLQAIGFIPDYKTFLSDAVRWDFGFINRSYARDCRNPFKRYPEDFLVDMATRALIAESDSHDKYVTEIDNGVNNVLNFLSATREKVLNGNTQNELANISEQGIKEGIGSEEVTYAENEMRRNTKDRTEDRGV